MHHRHRRKNRRRAVASVIGLRQRRGAMHRHGENRRRAVSYVSTGLARLPRDINAFATTAEERLYMSSLDLHPLVAERRHSSVTRYAKRSVACRDSPRHQPLRAGGTPLPHHRRLPHPSDCPLVAIHRHRRKPPKSGCRNAIPVCARGALLLVTPSARRDSGGRMGHRRGHHLYALRRCATSPSRRGVPSLKKPPPNGLPTPWL